MRIARAKLTRRELIKRFGILAFALSPVAKAMGLIAGGPFVDAARFVMFFKGGSLHPKSNNPSTIDALAGTPLAPLQPHSTAARRRATATRRSTARG